MSSFRSLLESATGPEYSHYTLVRERNHWILQARSCGKYLLLEWNQKFYSKDGIRIWQIERRRKKNEKLPSSSNWKKKSAAQLHNQKEQFGKSGAYFSKEKPSKSGKEKRNT